MAPKKTTLPDSNISEDDYIAAPTRPTNATRHVGVTKPRKVTRYTLDLEAETHMYLRLYAIQQNVNASVVMRTLLYLLEADQTLQQRVAEEIYARLNEDTDSPEEE